MRTTTWILVLGCAGVLVGAYFGSRLLVNDVPTPVSAVAAPEVVKPAVLVAPTRREEAEAAMLGPRQGPLTPVSAPSLPRLVEENVPAVPADVATSPFQGDSKELDYAEALLAEANPGLERLVSAHTVLSRCVQQEPSNERCRRNLAVAQSRLGGKVATERQPPPPTLREPPPHLNRPASMPK